MTIETDLSVVTPQTHVMIGMFRPPWENIIGPLTEPGIYQREREKQHVFWPSVVVPMTGQTFKFEYGNYKDEIRLHDAWLQGRLDTPQYVRIEDWVKMKGAM